MNKKYQRVEIFGNTFDSVYHQCQRQAREQGVDLEYSFNGTIINSDMSLDDAYLAYFGQTKTAMNEHNSQLRTAEHNRQVDLLMSVIETKTKELGPTKDLSRWLESTRNDIDRDKKHAEKALLSLKIAAQIQKSGSIYDAMMFTARADCSQDIDKQYACRRAVSLVSNGYDEYTSRVSEMASILDSIEKYYKNLDLDLGSIEKFPRELFERYDAARLGIEYTPPTPQITPEELKNRGAGVCRPDKLDAWNTYVDEAFKKGGSYIVTAAATMHILEKYESGARLRDVRDTMLVVSNLSSCIPWDLKQNLFDTQFGRIALADHNYLRDGSFTAWSNSPLIQEPNMSVPQARIMCLERAASIIPEYRFEDLTKSVDSALAWGADMSKQVLAGLDYIEAINNGIPFKDVKQQFEADDRFAYDMAISVAMFVEQFSDVEGIRKYLSTDGPMPDDPRKGPTGQDDHDGRDFIE